MNYNNNRINGSELISPEGKIQLEMKKISYA
jgi:hypothetical protein